MHEDGGEALQIFRWWLQSSTFDTMGMGVAVGPPEWPRPGGLANQDAKLVQAVDLLRSDWPAWRRGKEGPRRGSAGAARER